MPTLEQRLQRIEATLASMGGLVEDHDRKIASGDRLRLQLSAVQAALDEITELRRWHVEMKAERAERETYDRLKRKFGN